MNTDSACPLSQATTAMTTYAPSQNWGNAELVSLAVNHAVTIIQ